MTMGYKYRTGRIGGGVGGVSTSLVRRKCVTENVPIENMGSEHSNRTAAKITKRHAKKKKKKKKSRETDGSNIKCLKVLYQHLAGVTEENHQKTRKLNTDNQDISFNPMTLPTKSV
jgi:hypothetical protein